METIIDDKKQDCVAANFLKPLESFHFGGEPVTIVSLAQKSDRQFPVSSQNLSKKFGCLKIVYP